MFFEVTSKRAIADNKGNDKMMTEVFVVDNATMFGEAEAAVLLEYNMTNIVSAIKQSNISEFINERADDEQQVYLSTFEVHGLSEDGKPVVSKVVVALFATSVQEATDIMLKHLSTSVDDTALVEVKKSKIVDIIRYLNK